MLTEAQAAAFPVVQRLLAGGRGLLFENPKSSLPYSRDRTVQADDLIPQTGFIGHDYKFGGLVIVGINPGNGDRHMRNVSDERMMPALHAFSQRPDDEEAYKKAMEAQLQGFRGWSSTEELRVSLAFLRVPINAVAYTNAITYRAGKKAEDVFPNNSRKHLSAEYWLGPWLKAVQPPGVVVALGKIVAEVIRLADPEIKPVIFSRDHIAARRNKENADFVSRLRGALRAEGSNSRTKG
jgi:hypothetical protein